MQRRELLDLLEETPIVAAVKSGEELKRSLESDSPMVFLLFGDVCNVGELVAKVKSSGKLAMVHVDLIEGLSARDVTVDFIAGHTAADGIISTKPNLIRRAKSLELITIQRFFLLDSLALFNIQKQLAQDSADLIEVLPGVMPKIIRKIVATAQQPVIAGGLISDKEDVMSALGAGASAVSSTNPEVWFL